MADEIQRNKLYEYGANSNLVLEAERDGRRRGDEGKGEVETLSGKLDYVRMGDRLSKSSRPEELNEKPVEKRVKVDSKRVSENSQKEASIVFLAPKGSNVLMQTENMESIMYRPKTKESKLAYEELLRTVQGIIGDQPEDILKGATEEILMILKEDTMRDTIKHKEIEKITTNLTNQNLSKLMEIGKRITDYNIKEADNEEEAKMDEEMAVVFDDDDDEVQQVDLDDSADMAEDDDDREGDDAAGHRQLKGVTEKVEDGDVDDRYNLSVFDIDAHWLQRQLSRFYNDANISSKLAEETLTALQTSDERLCENKLVVLLDFDKFEFIKLLLKNRFKIYYCTKLKQAQTDSERSVIEEEIRNDNKGDGLLLLQTLKQKASAESWTQDRIGQFASKARREARSLNKSDNPQEDEMDEEERVNNKSDVSFLSRSEKILDLEGLSFNEGSHLMANTRCELPEKSWRAQKKGYEEVHVPALRPVISPNEKIVDIADLPDWAQPAFSNIKSLNRIQSKMVDAALYGAENILLCAPTGSGKTNVALLCMLNLLGTYRKSDGRYDLDSFKIVYIAPMKALVQECVQSFGKRLAPYGVQVRELSGDQNLTREQIQQTQVIITTPEKWDIITRKSGDRTYTQLVQLVIVDEIHLLHDDRGPVLESLIARTIRQIESTQDMVRLVGLSATLPNYEDVATFLRVKPKKGLFFFDNSYRPVPLQQQYIGVTEKKALKRFQLINEICYEKVLQQAGKNQVLIFTHSRSETAKTAKALRDLAASNDTLSRFVRDDSASLEILKVESESAKNADLKDLLPYGFAIHHAGMVRSDRTLVEDLFADKHIQVLVSTATLAWGVNLPVHTVIIKGTQMYSPEQGRWVELSPLDIMQMMGRAGRYGLDTEGEGIIITAHSELQYYLSLMNQQLPIESQFIKKLPDMLNAEIVLGSISTVKEATSWLGYTYLYVRMLRNPSLYGISADSTSDPTLLQHRADLIHSAAAILDKHDLIKYDRKSGTFQSTALGRVASHYYVSHDSINIFSEIMRPSMNEIEIFRLFSLSGEFKFIHVREEEKLELSKLIARVPVPVKESVEESSSKVNVLLQSFISRLKLEGFALVADMTYIQQSACRLMRALFEIAIKRGWASLSEKLLNVCKMVERRQWLSQSPLRQFGNIPDVIIRKLEKNSDLAWDRYFDLKPQDFGEMVKIPKMGKSLYKFVHMFPKVLLNAQVLPITRSMLKIDLSITPDFDADPQVHDSNMLFWVIVEDVDGEKILHYEAFILNNFSQKSKNSSDSPVEHLVNFTVALQDPLPPHYFIKVISDRWLHAETILPVTFRHLILPQKYPPPTELLDLQPLPVAAFRNQVFESIFKSFKYFNPIQTQTFSTLYESDENCLVCATSGSGKLTCAELAILRLFSKNLERVDSKVVYVVAKKEIAHLTFINWRSRIGGLLGKNVVILTGDSASDLNLLDHGDVVIAWTNHWDVLSRKWKQRKSIQNIALYIFDELHLIGGSEGPVLEIVVSRARFIASQLEKSVRIIGLSASLANSKDVGDWIGAASHSIYNFAPDVRPVPLDIQLLSFETNHFSSRLLSMAKPAFNAISKHANNKPVIVVVPSRKQAQLTAIDILSFSGSSSGTNQYFKGDDSVRERILSMDDDAVAQSAVQGVAFVHSGLSDSDREIIESAFTHNHIQILVVAQNMCWSLKVQCHLIIIMDTVYYEGRENRYIDYSITDLLHMIGMASRQGIDQSAKCVVMCHAPKKEYLKKLLHEPLPIESHLDHYLHDHLNAEIVSKTIENKPDAVDYLTWSFLYRRLTQNPNYYNLQGTSHRHLSDHLSELIENVISDLEESKCVAVEEEIELTPLNLGMISCYYYIEYTTVELFASSLTAKTKTKGLLEIITAASEFSRMNIRISEDQQLQKLSSATSGILRYPLLDGASFDDPSTKALILLQSHLSRFFLTNELVEDQKDIILESTKLLQAAVDVISSQGWLKPALAAMELSQMIVQGQWDKDSVLLQIPHMNSELINSLKSLSEPVLTVFDLLEMDDSVRESVFTLSPEKMSDIAFFCNSYPNIELAYELSDEGEVEEGESILLNVKLTRDIDDDVEDVSTIGRVVCPRFPSKTFRKEGYWLVVGDPANNALFSIKRIALVAESK
eukprot:gene8839-11930_t